MSTKEEEGRGGFHFGNVGRDAKMTAGGDIVAGDTIGLLNRRSAAPIGSRSWTRIRIDIRPHLPFPPFNVQVWRADPKNQTGLNILQELVRRATDSFKARPLSRFGKIDATDKNRRST